MGLSTGSNFEIAMETPYNLELAMLTIAEASGQIRSGSVTATQLTAAMLQRIAAEDAHLNSYISVNGESALSTAQTLDEEREAGQLRGPLHGIPIALKDNIDIAGVPTTAASGVFEDRIPPEDAEVTRRLRAAGGRPLPG